MADAKHGTGRKAGKDEVKMADLLKVKSTVAKLIALAEGTPYEPEKEAALSRANALMQKYGFSQKECQKETSERIEVMKSRKFYSFLVKNPNDLYTTWETYKVERALKCAIHRAKVCAVVFNVYVITRCFHGFNPVEIDPLCAFNPSCLKGGTYEKKLWCSVNPDGTVHYHSTL